MTSPGTAHFGTPPAPPVIVRGARPGHPAGPLLEDLLSVARRDNPRRQVLFVSKVLGKHLVVDAGLPVLAGMALGELVAAQLDGNDGTQRFDAMEALANATRTGRRVTVDELAPPEAAASCVVLGFAETATALTPAVRRQLGRGPLGHTTRVDAGVPVLRAHEAHSHAVDHSVHHHDPGVLDHREPVVVVDDEFTTGATALGLILEIQRRWPRPRYVLASLIDWRAPRRRQELVDALAAAGSRLDTVALIDAEVDIAAAPPLPSSPRWPATPAPTQPGPAPSVIDLSVGPPTARCGWSLAHQGEVDNRLARAGEHMATRRHGAKALVLGLEELMYVPMMLGVHLGGGTQTRSTTRSPIVAGRARGYPIRDLVEFAPTDGSTGRRFLYNLEGEHHDDVFVVSEPPHPPVDHPLFPHLSSIGDHVHLVRLS